MVGSRCVPTTDRSYSASRELHLGTSLLIICVCFHVLYNFCCFYSFVNN